LLFVYCVLIKLTPTGGAAAAALLALTGAAWAQTGAPEVREIGDYAVRCMPVANPSPCDMFTAAINKETGQRYMTMSIAFTPSTNRFVIQITLPLGVLIEKGAIIETSAFTTEAMVYRRCDRTNCYVEAFAPQALIDGFRKAGPQGKIKMVGDDDKPYEYPLSFKGFSEAADYMIEQNRAKAKAAPAQ
jgi:invasion protein IalB